MSSHPIRPNDAIAIFLVVLTAALKKASSLRTPTPATSPTVGMKQLLAVSQSFLATTQSHMVPIMRLQSLSHFSLPKSTPWLLTLATTRPPQAWSLVLIVVTSWLIFRRTPLPSLSLPLLQPSLLSRLPLPKTRVLRLFHLLRLPNQPQPPLQPRPMVVSATRVRTTWNILAGSGSAISTIRIITVRLAGSFKRRTTIIWQTTKCVH